MKKIRTKLNNERGVSILFAMMLFLVASMVSITIVSAALSAAKAVHNSNSARQDMLALESAAKLIEYELLGREYDIVTTTKVGDEPTVTKGINKNGTITPLGANDVFMQKTVTLLESAHSTASADNPDFAGITADISDFDFPAVTVSAELKADSGTDGETGADDSKANTYRLILTLETPESVNPGHNASVSRMFLSFEISYSDSTRSWTKDVEGITENWTERTEKYIFKTAELSGTGGA